MAGVTGLEPAASGVTGRRSNQLSYTPPKAGDLEIAYSELHCQWLIQKYKNALDRSNKYY